MELFVSVTQYVLHRDENKKKLGKCIDVFHMHISRIIFYLSAPIAE